MPLFPPTHPSLSHNEGQNLTTVCSLTLSRQLYADPTRRTAETHSTHTCSMAFYLRKDTNKLGIQLKVNPRGTSVHTCTDLHVTVEPLSHFPWIPVLSVCGTVVSHTSTWAPEAPPSVYLGSTLIHQFIFVVHELYSQLKLCSSE